jgi:hypothetical protein
MPISTSVGHKAAAVGDRFVYSKLGRVKHVSPVTTKLSALQKGEKRMVTASHAVPTSTDTGQFLPTGFDPGNTNFLNTCYR